MISYVTLGTKDIHKAAKFYDALAEELGAKRMMGSEEDNFIAWSRMDGSAGVGLTAPFDGNPATVGNGVMVALDAKSSEQVHKIYDLAMSLGGTDEGEPGPRGGGSFYCAYFRDPDGNKLNAFFMETPPSS